MMGTVPQIAFRAEAGDGARTQGKSFAISRLQKS